MTERQSGACWGSFIAAVLCVIGFLGLQYSYESAWRALFSAMWLLGWPMAILMGYVGFHDLATHPHERGRAPAMMGMVVGILMGIFTVWVLVSQLSTV